MLDGKISDGWVGVKALVERVERCQLTKLLELDSLLARRN